MAPLYLSNFSVFEQRSVVISRKTKLEQLIARPDGLVPRGRNATILLMRNTSIYFVSFCLAFSAVKAGENGPPQHGGATSTDDQLKAWNTEIDSAVREQKQQRPGQLRPSPEGPLQHRIQPGTTPTNSRPRLNSVTPQMMKELGDTTDRENKLLEQSRKLLLENINGSSESLTPQKKKELGNLLKEVNKVLEEKPGDQKVGASNPTLKTKLTPEVLDQLSNYLNSRPATVETNRMKEQLKSLKDASQTKPSIPAK